MRRLPTSAVAGRSSRHARRSTPPPTREGGGHESRYQNQSSSLRSRHLCSRWWARHRPRHPAWRGRRACRGWLARGQCLGGDPPRRHSGDPHRAFGDGPGHAHRPLPAGRRGTGMRLVEGNDRISDAWAESRVWKDFGTGGSRGIRDSHEYVRQGGATAREVLIQAAAQEWRVPASECKAANSIITHTPSGRSSTYGKVAEAAAKLQPPVDVKLKDPKDWKLAGKGVKRLDTPDKLTGKQVYGIDVKLPGMVNAAIKDCPVFGGKLKSFDAAKVASMPGVKKVVQVGDSAVAVVADTWWHAKTALDALPIDWDEGENAKVSSEYLAGWLKAGLDAEQAFVGNQNGDVRTALAGAAKKVEAVYTYPFQNHAPMEPMNATVRYTPDSCEV